MITSQNKTKTRVNLVGPKCTNNANQSKALQLQGSQISEDATRHATRGAGYMEYSSKVL